MGIIKSEQKIISACKDFISSSEIKSFLIAYSGGCDSSVLLHTMNLLKDKFQLNIRVAHINHNLTKESEAFAIHCKNICHKYNLEFINIDIYLDKSSNIEEQLRNKRYNALTEIAYQNEYILTGHHFDDQIETFFLRLMRGSSNKGLSCMSLFNNINNKIIARPLLNINKKDIEDYQKRNQLSFLNDTTNNSNKFDRNFIRNEIIPKLKSRWSSLNNVMKSNIEHQKINSIILDDIIIDKLNHIYDSSSKKLSLVKLKQENNFIQSEIIHKWFSLETNILLNHYQISEILNTIINTDKDSTPEFTFHSFSIRKYQGFLYLINKLSNKDIHKSKKWDLSDDLKFNELIIKISKLKELGIYDFLHINQPVIVRRREGGEKILLNSKFHQKLKKIFQSKNIPIWERDSYAFIFVKEELIAAYGPNDIIISNTNH